ncbi:hypothetical protein CDIK_2925 [Cucumispora dikerogammari]|nr:hypothetical protein CDIK_2925 [Cucumispora dikerogammari]
MTEIIYTRMFSYLSNTLTNLLETIVIDFEKALKNFLSVCFPNDKIVWMSVSFWPECMEKATKHRSAEYINNPLFRSHIRMYLDLTFVSRVVLIPTFQKIKNSHTIADTFLYQKYLYFLSYYESTMYKGFQ